jgi:hypothetical protein
MAYVIQITREKMDEMTNSWSLLVDFVKNFNDCLKRNPLALLEITEFCVNPFGYSELGYPVNEVEAWFEEALPSLKEMMINGEFEFCLGSIGSIWCDVHLRGNGKNKLTRVTLMNNPLLPVQKYNIMLDATFNRVW